MKPTARTWAALAIGLSGITCYVSFLVWINREKAPGGALHSTATQAPENPITTRLASSNHEKAPPGDSHSAETQAPEGRFDTRDDTSVLEATESQFAVAQGKITYIGPQTKPIMTVVFATSASDASMQLFRGFEPRDKQWIYANDHLSNHLHFRVTASEFKRLVLSVKPVLNARHPSDGADCLSFVICYQAGHLNTGHEFSISWASAADFYTCVIGALDVKNKEGIGALRLQCANVGVATPAGDSKENR
jgi:hypothetical protein